MLVLFVDLETTQEKPVEIAGVAYDTDIQCMVGSFSNLLWADIDDRDDSPVHKIPNAAVRQWGIEREHDSEDDRILLKEILQKTPYCEADFSYVIAHKASFERQYIDTKIPWLCSWQDFDFFPSHYQGRRDLVSLAQWYGVGVTVTHRAIYDCLLLAEVFSRVPDLAKEFEYALRPKVEWLAPLYDGSGNKQEHPPLGFRWDYDLMGWFGKTGGHTTGDVFFPVGDRIKVYVSKDSFKHKDTASRWGFKWDGDRKIWWRLVNPHTPNLFPFPLQIVEEDSCDF